MIAEARAHTAVGLAPTLVLCLHRDGCFIHIGPDQPILGLGPAQLVLLARLGRAEPAPLGHVVKQVADASGLPAEQLWSFTEELRLRGILIDDRAALEPPAVPTRSVAAPPASTSIVSPSSANAEVMVRTPVFLRLHQGAFEHLDHDGAVLLRLEARELAATTALTRPATLAAGLDRHQAMAGPLALGEAQFHDLVGRLLTIGFAREVEPSHIDYSGRGRLQLEIQMDLDRKAEVAKIMDAETARFHAAEKERAERTGIARPKIIPVEFNWRIVPLNLGMLIAYAKAHAAGQLDEAYGFNLSWLTDPGSMGWTAHDPAIFLFPNYLWSSPENMALSAQLKVLNPANITVHGGPNTPKYEADVEVFFAEHPHVDIAVRGEGEATFAHLLEALIGHAFDGPPDLSTLANVPGLSYRAPDGQVVRTADRDRIEDLDTIPSPYLTGLFDSYGVGHLKSAILETNRGCPYGCTFCDWGSATLSRIRKFDMDRVLAELDWCGANEVNQVSFADANMGIFERDVAIAEKIAALHVATGYPKRFGSNYAKNTAKHLAKIIGTLTGAGVFTDGTLSLQTMDGSTLSAVKRSNIKVEKYDTLAAEFRKAKLPLLVDLMIGLPGATVDSFRQDLQECIDREVTAKIFPTQLLVNSPMNDPAYRAEHKIEAKPGGLLLSAATYTRADHDEMLRMRRMYLLCERYGVLRQVARYVRQATGIGEATLFDRIRHGVHAQPHRWPAITFTLASVPDILVPPVSWRLFIDDVHHFVVEQCGVADDYALATVLAVQHGVLPARDRTYPLVLNLDHDYAAWHAAIVTAKHEAHYRDWPELVPPLASLPPARFVIDDTHRISEFIGSSIEWTTDEGWELDTSIARPMNRMHEAV